MWLNSCEGERKHVCECDIWSTLMRLVVIAPAVAYERVNFSIQWHPAHWHYLSLLLATSATICISNTGLLCPYAVNGGKMDRFCIGSTTCVSHTSVWHIFSIYIAKFVAAVLPIWRLRMCKVLFFIQPKMITNYGCHNITFYIIIMAKTFILFSVFTRLFTILSEILNSPSITNFIP